MYEYPPILTGDALQQIAALRDYLVRQTRDRDHQITETAAKEIQIVGARAAAKNGKQTPSDSEKQLAQSLRALIIKTADVVESHVEAIYTELHSDYTAISEDFGTYKDTVNARFEAMADGITAQFEETEQILTPIQQFTTELSGAIRLGIIEDPETHERAIGIVIGQHVQFTGATETHDGYEYQVLDEGQTTGIYTSTGWQFWINGRKVGWFDTEDSSLHVSRILVETQLQHGSDWLVTTVGGYGIRYIGS